MSTDDGVVLLWSVLCVALCCIVLCCLCASCVVLSCVALCGVFGVLLCFFDRPESSTFAFCICIFTSHLHFVCACVCACVRAKRSKVEATQSTASATARQPKANTCPQTRAKRQRNWCRENERNQQEFRDTTRSELGNSARIQEKTIEQQTKTNQTESKRNQM